MTKPKTFREFTDWIASLDLSQDDQNSLIIAGLDMALPEDDSEFDSAGLFIEHGEGFEVNVPARALWFVMLHRDVWKAVEDEGKQIASDKDY